jgi:hypothetical protein
MQKDVSEEKRSKRKKKNKQMNLHPEQQGFKAILLYYIT